VDEVRRLVVWLMLWAIAAWSYFISSVVMRYLVLPFIHK
jgi:hypothetical protein